MMLRKLGNKLLVRISAPLLAVAIFAIPNSLEASILLPVLSSYNFEQMLAAKKFAPNTPTSSSSMSSSVASSLVSANRRHDDLPKESNRPSQQLFITLQTFFGGSSPGSSSSSASSTGGNVGTDSFPSALSAPVTLFDMDHHVAWVSGERRFSLSTAPGNEILRPPQAG